jgi:hypothetical protein
MWPHRYNADKQPDIAEDLAADFNMIITQKMNLSKEQYYQTMGASKAIFSCSLHENLGISIMEAVLAGAIPIVPDRCSYSEMYLDEFKYPSEWTANVTAYQENKDKLVKFIKDRIDNYQDYVTLLERQRDILKQEYLSANIMIDNILNANN